MKDNDISTPEQLNAALVRQSMEKHRKLWAATQGQFSSIAIIGLVCGAGLILLGLFAPEEEPIDRIFALGLGVYMFCQFQIYFAQSRAEALAKLLRRLEQRVARLEKQSWPEGRSARPPGG